MLSDMTKKPKDHSNQDQADSKPMPADADGNPMPPADDVFVIRNFKMGELHADPRNARVHGGESVQAIKMSLERFGQQKPIVVDKNNKIISGHGTVQAAKELGWEGIDAIVTDLTGDDAIAFAITDNRTAELSMWDGTELSSQLEYLQFDYGTFFHNLGFTEELLSELGAIEEVPPAELTEPMAQSRTKEEYNSSSIRQILFLFEESVYNRVVTAMDLVMADKDLKTHADVLLSLLGVEKHENN